MESHITYDGSFDGFLTVVFFVYKEKITPLSFRSDLIKVHDLFVSSHHVVSDISYAKRVQVSIINRSSKKTFNYLYRCFLSERGDVESKLFYVIQNIMNGNSSIMRNYAYPVIMDLHKIHKGITREVHRMHAFVRFQELKDGLYTAVVEPDFNVLPLLPKHFVDRYPGFKWLIYDTHRGYGIYYNGETVERCSFESGVLKENTHLPKESLSEEEQDYQSLWIQYLKSVNIKERNNPRLHRRHVPKRYWKNLIEKNIESLIRL